MNRVEHKKITLFVVTFALSLFVLFVISQTDFDALPAKPQPLPVVVEPAKPIPVFEEEIVAPVEPYIDSAELDCLAKNIYHEARGEPYEGKLAVAHVTLNRVHHKRFPDTVCGVVHQAVYSKWWLEARGRKVPVRHKCQFSWYCDGKSDEIQLSTAEGEPIVGNVKAWAASQQAAMEVLMGISKDNTNGATFYFNPDLADPFWYDKFNTTTVIGNHLFMTP